MPARPSARRSLVALLLALAGALAGCDADADIVAVPLDAEAGGGADGGGTGGDAAVDPCAPSERLRRARLPAFALDLVLDCSAKFTAFTDPQDGGATLSPEQLNLIFTAPMLEPDPGSNAPSPCSARQDVGWYFTPLLAPDSVKLCRETCELFRSQVAFLLARDGCDGPTDAGLPPGLGPFTGGDGDDAGHR